MCGRAAVECTCQGLRRAARAISKVYEAAFTELDLTATQFAILVAVHLRGPVPLSRLAERLVLDRTSLYRAVKPLERRGCLRVVPGRTGRERLATLTGKGRRLLEDALPIWEGVQQRVVRALGSRTWAALTSGLDRVVSSVPRIESGTVPRATGAPRHPAAAG